MLQKCVPVSTHKALVTSAERLCTLRTVVRCEVQWQSAFVCLEDMSPRGVGFEQVSFNTGAHSLDTLGTCTED